MVLSSEEERCQEGFSTMGKIWRFKRKTIFLVNILEESDILLIFASDGILWHYTKYLKNTKQL